MNKFKNQMTEKINNIPVIIILATNNLTMNIETMQKRVNMSIPETFLSLSNDVIVLVASNNTKVLMTKGCFDIFETLVLENHTVLNDLPSFNFEMLNLVHVDGNVPANLIKLKGVNGYIDLNILYTTDYIPENILIGLCDRACIPKINLDMLHPKLLTMYTKLRENPELDNVRQELYNIASSDESGSDKHKELIAKYNSIKSKKYNIEQSSLLKALNNLMSYIAEYKRDATSIVFGSNRANRAVVFDNHELDKLDDCIQIECPILMDIGDACIMLKCPEKLNYIEEYTSDYAMESPFEFGTWLADLVTPGIYCYDMAKNMRINPYSREEVIGFLPLSTNPTIIMKHMSKLFGKNREMWHFVRGFISMLVHACNKEWVDKVPITQCLRKLFDEYNVTIDLKGGSDKVSLLKAFEHVLRNYSTCLRDRTYGDNVAIMNIAKFIMPQYVFDKEKIEGMISVIKEFAFLLNEHKQNVNMIKYVMCVDEYDHYVKYIGGVKGLIAQLLWYDTTGSYKLMKLQMATNKALTDKKFGPSLICAFNGIAFDESILECKLPEPTGIHFEEEKFSGKISDRIDAGIMPDTRCVFCGVNFHLRVDKLDHLRYKLGNHFYNGHLSVVHTISKLGKTANTKDLFVEVKRRLYKKYGDKSKFLHTQRCKNRLLEFIEKMKTQS